MGNYQNQSIYPVTKELSYFDLHSCDEKEESYTFINTVRQHFDEIVRLESKHQEPATIVVQEDDTNSNGSIEQDESNKTLMENKKQKADVQNMLISNSLTSMMNNIQADGNMVSLLARDIDIPLTMRESITNMFGDMLSKVNDVWNTNSLPKYFQTEEQSSDKANETEIEVEVCTKRREITFWEKTKSTSLKMATLLLPSELLNDKGGSSNDTLPFYNPGQ